MFEDLKDYNDSMSLKYVSDPFSFIENCIRDTYFDNDFISKEDYLVVLHIYKMLYDNWFHGDN